MSASTSWSGPWNPEQWTTGDKGVWVLGKIKETRFHAITTKDSLFRFVALDITVEHAFERSWNQFQNEHVPDTRKPERSANKKLTVDELAKTVKLPNNLVSNDILKKLHPQVPGVVELWADPDLVKGVDAGAGVILKTEGGFFVKWIQSSSPGQVSGKLNEKEGALMGAVGGIMASVDEDEVLKHGIVCDLVLCV